MIDQMYGAPAIIIIQLAAIGFFSTDEDGFNNNKNTIKNIEVI